MSISRYSQGRTCQTHQKSQGDMSSFLRKVRETENFTVVQTLFQGILLKITSSLCKIKFKVTIGVKNTAHYTYLLYILLTVMEIFNTIVFVSSLMITTTIQILFMKYKQSLLITLKKTFQLWLRSSISLMAGQSNIRIAKTLLICVINKISV